MFFCIRHQLLIFVFSVLFGTSASASSVSSVELVLLKDGTQLCPREQRDSLCMNFPTHDLSSLYVFRLLEASGDWVKIETAPSSLEHCFGTLELVSSSLRITFFVPIRELENVLVKDYSKHFEDGTGIQLRRGVRIVSGISNQSNHFETDELVIFHSVPEEMVGSKFTFDLDNYVSGKVVGRKRIYDVGAMNIGGGRVLQKRTAKSYRDYIDVSDIKKTEDGFLVTKTDKCGQLRMAVKQYKLDTASGRDLTNKRIAKIDIDQILKEQDYEKSVVEYVKAGSLVYWPNGDIAGYSIKRDSTILGLKTTSEDKNRFCYLTGMEYSSPSKDNKFVKICIKKVDVVTRFE